MAKIKVADLDQEGAEFRVAKGGKGGSGNLQDKQLSILQRGLKGEEKHFELRLKLIADVGFIGYPNAGKSTLLAAVSIKS
jgi:GTP-binding protein